MFSESQAPGIQINIDQWEHAIQILIVGNYKSLKPSYPDESIS